MTIIFDQERLLFKPTTPDSNAIQIIFCFPNSYSVGITSLGYQTVWATFASRNDVNVSRLFTDIKEPLPKKSELLGFSFSWELDYVNVFDILDILGIPLQTNERDENHPLIFGGGPTLTANPEPFADFFDVILLGDGEKLIHDFLEAYKIVRNESRAVKLSYLATIPGIYIPSLYEITYYDYDGEIKSIKAIETDTPSSIEKQIYRGNSFSTSTVVTKNAVWENIYMLEVVRSCPEMCRFCLVSYLNLPFRIADLDTSLIPNIEKGLKVTNRIGLLGPSITQHPEFDSLLNYLNQPKYDDIRVSIASVRANTVTERLANLLTNRNTKSITIAVESGSAKIRKNINKKLDNDEIINAAINAKIGGLKNIKLYGMVGIPGEDEEDVEQTILMLDAIQKAAQGLKITFGCSTFIPKSHTPFQWLGVNKLSKKRLKYLEKVLGKKRIEFRPESYNWSIIQALISRGDRRLSKLFKLTRHYGNSLGSYKRAFKELKGEIPSLEYYVHSIWKTDQILPWSHLKGPLPHTTLVKHFNETKF